MTALPSAAAELLAASSVETGSSRRSLTAREKQMIVSGRLKADLGLAFVLIVAVLAGVRVGVMLGEWRRTGPRPIAAVRAAKEHTVAAALLASPRGIHYNTTTTAIAFVNSQCRVCTESLKFYGRLQSKLRATKGRFIAVSLEPTDATRSFLVKGGVSVDAILDYHDLGVPLNGTPTLILVGRGGPVLRSWTGRLSPAQEAEAMAICK